MHKHFLDALCACDGQPIGLLWIYPTKFIVCLALSRRILANLPIKAFYPGFDGRILGKRDAKSLDIWNTITK